MSDSSMAIWVALIGAGAASIVAFLGFWITYKTSTAALLKSTKLQVTLKKADFRREWIEQLRRSVADYNARASTLVHAQTKTIDQADYGELVRITEFIEMLLNHAESSSTDLINALRSVLDAATAVNVDPDKFYRARKAAQGAARIIMKTEWDRLNDDLDKELEVKGN